MAKINNLREHNETQELFRTPGAVIFTHVHIGPTIKIIPRVPPPCKRE